MLVEEVFMVSRRFAIIDADGNERSTRQNDFELVVISGLGDMMLRLSFSESGISARLLWVGSMCNVGIGLRTIGGRSE